MTNIDHSNLTQFKICILGSKTVGKTYLTRKISDNFTYAKYRSTTSIDQFFRVNEQKGVKYIYYDYPSLDLMKTYQFSVVNEANLLMLLFKDSASFADLFQFLQKITKMSKESGFKGHLLPDDCSIYLIYNSFEEKAVVQSNQLFQILQSEIKKINGKVQVKCFHWKQSDFNAHEIRKSLEQIQVAKKLYNYEKVTQSTYKSKDYSVQPALKKSGSEVTFGNSKLKDQYFSRLKPLDTNLNNQNGVQLYEVKQSKIKKYRDSKVKDYEVDESVDESEKDFEINGVNTSYTRKKIQNPITEAVREAHKRQRIQLLKSQMNYMENQNRKNGQQRVTGLDSKTCACQIM